MPKLRKINFATVRRDLQGIESVPLTDKVGNTVYYSGGKAFQYRYDADDNVEVLYEGEWMEVVSIDWDFEEITIDDE